jgi:hypothetical protein
MWKTLQCILYLDIVSCFFHYCNVKASILAKTNLAPKYFSDITYKKPIIYAVDKKAMLHLQSRKKS